ncbi:MAG: hypothetical protein ACPLX8_00320, partial [Nanopusillaceae archaeon]
FCQKYVAVGNGWEEVSPGYYVCANAVPCSVVLQQWGSSSGSGQQACVYQGTQITPLACMYFLCKHYISDLYYDPANATALIFGTYTQVSLAPGNIKIAFDTPSKALNPGPTSACNGNIPTWITNQIFGALYNILQYYNNHDCKGGNLGLTVENGILYVNGSCSTLKVNGEEPLCKVLIQMPYSIIAQPPAP